MILQFDCNFMLTSDSCVEEEERWPMSWISLV